MSADADASPVRSSPAIARAPARPECSGCYHPLDLHQLDEQIPDRLLGYCPPCSRLYRSPDELDPGPEWIELRPWYLPREEGPGASLRVEPVTR